MILSSIGRRGFIDEVVWFCGVGGGGVGMGTWILI